MSGAPHLVPGFADPVLDSQAVFRSVLTALSEPGRVMTALNTPREAPPPVSPIAYAAILMLCDTDTPLWLDTVSNQSLVRETIAFHTGAPTTRDPAKAIFALVQEPVSMPPLEAFCQGIAEYPDRSTTLIIQVKGFERDVGPRWRGPGIQTSTRLQVNGLPPAFWRQWRNNHDQYPLGVDILFVAGNLLVGLPRSTHIEDA
ncbi:MAG: phosphonate C-P lyase system protein PhnH [Geminicoccaceae bacterium]